MEKKFYARAPSSSMWLGKDGLGGWKAYQDFGRAWAFEDSQKAKESWDAACLASIARCAKNGESVPAWALATPALLRGHTPEGMPGSFDYYLGIIDGRFVCERPSGMALSTDERDAKVFGSLDEAKSAVMSMRTAKCKSLAVLPMSCRAEHPVEIDGAKLDALAAASYAKRLREEWQGLVPPAREGAQEDGSGSGSDGSGQEGEGASASGRTKSGRSKSL